MEEEFTSMRKQKYYPAESLGEGSYGAVHTVYDDNGEMFALKEFEPTDDDDSMCGSLSLGTLREISVLRMFSSIRPEEKNRGHVNIMSVHDICISDFNHTLCMVMPKYTCNLTKAIKSNCLSNKQKLSIAHQLLTGVAFLHKNDIIHRDIKSDNILLDSEMNPVLADFSLAKLFDGKARGSTHTGEVGTSTYKAPEIYHSEAYNLLSDVYSLGVVFLELFHGILEADKDKSAFKYVEDIRNKLSKTQPLPILLYCMLDPNPKTRISCEEALKLDVFRNFPFPTSIKKTLDKIVRVPRTKSSYSQSSRPKKSKKKVQTEEDEETELADYFFEALEFSNPLTKQAAIVYHSMAAQPMEHCMILAGKMFESELLDMSCVEEFLEEFDIEDYIESEMNIFVAMDFCLFI